MKKYDEYFQKFIENVMWFRFRVTSKFIDTPDIKKFEDKLDKFIYVPRDTVALYRGCYTFKFNEIRKMLRFN